MLFFVFLGSIWLNLNLKPKIMKKAYYAGFLGVLCLFLCKSAYAEVSKPYFVDEKPQVLFGDSVEVEGYQGLENYTTNYINDYLHISFTYTHTSSSWASYPPYLYISDIDPRIATTTLTERSVGITFDTIYASTTDWYLIDIQFDSTGYTLIAKQKGIYEIYNSHFNLRDSSLAGTEWISLVNDFSRFGGSGNVNSMSFTPLTVSTSTQSCTVNCNSSLMFIPGIMGSRLYENNSGEKELWFSTSDSEHARLVLDSNGESVNQVYTKDDSEAGIVDEVFSSNIYKSFINNLRNWEEEGVISDHALMPYDWRLSLEDIITNGATTTGSKLYYNNSQDFSESYFLKKLQELKKNSKNGKVTIVAHSNGGLVAKALIQKLKDTNNSLYYDIDQVILVAVPQIGTPDAIGVLLHGSSIGGGAIMYNQRSRQLSENMSTVYNLLPSSSYWTTVDSNFAVDKVVSFQNDPVFQAQLSQYGVYVSNETELKNYILGTDGRVKPAYSDTDNPNIGNPSLYSNAQVVHSALDNWTPASTTKVVQIAGWGEETLAGLDYKKCADRSVVGHHKCYKPRWVIDGDGTVVVPSALWMSENAGNIERWWVDLEKYNENNAPDRVHRSILEVTNISDFLKSKIQRETFSDSENIIVSDTSTLVSNEDKLHYTLHSPLTLGVEDVQGRYTGLDPITLEVTEEIPNVSFKQLGETKFISVPKDLPHTLKLKGYDSGSFSLDIDEQIGNVLEEKVSFQGVPTLVGTNVLLEYIPGVDLSSSTLRLDQNNDGVFEKEIKADSQSIIYDETAPEVLFSFSTSTKEVVFSAKDDSLFTVSTSTKNIEAVDAQGNKSVLFYIKYKETPTKLKFSFDKILRNGIETKFPKTEVSYDWKEKGGVLTDLDTRVTIKGVERYIFSYNRSKGVTTVQKKFGKNTAKEIVNGFVSVKVETKEDELLVSY